MSTDLTREDILELIEDQPLSPAPWRQMLTLCHARKDFFRAKAISILIDGLERRRNSGSSSEGLLKTSDSAMLLRLPVARDIMPLLRELARFFLNEVGDTRTALRFCEQVLETGMPDEDCQAMLKECERELTAQAEAARPPSPSARSATPNASTPESTTTAAPGSNNGRGRSASTPPVAQPAGAQNNSSAASKGKSFFAPSAKPPAASRALAQNAAEALARMQKQALDEMEVNPPGNEVYPETGDEPVEGLLEPDAPTAHSINRAEPEPPPAAGRQPQASSRPPLSRGPSGGSTASAGSVLAPMFPPLPGSTNSSSVKPTSAHAQRLPKTGTKKEESEARARQQRAKSQPVLAETNTPPSASSFQDSQDTRGSSSQPSLEAAREAAKRAEPPPRLKGESGKVPTPLRPPKAPRSSGPLPRRPQSQKLENADLRPPPSIRSIWSAKTQSMPGSGDSSSVAAENTEPTQTPVQQPPLEAQPTSLGENDPAMEGIEQPKHVTETKHYKPQVSKLIVKTGKVSLIAAMAAAMEAEAQEKAARTSRHEDDAPPIGPGSAGSAARLKPESQTPATSGTTNLTLQAHQAAYKAQKEANSRSGHTKPLPAFPRRPVGPPPLPPSAPLPPQPAQKTPAELLDGAMQLLTDNEPEAAEKLIKEASALNPDTSQAFEVWTMLGHLHFQAGRPFKAAGAYREAMRYGGDVMPAWFNMALALQQTGKLDEALHHYLRADSIEKDHPKVWCNLGALYFQLDRFDESEQALRKVVQIQPRYARAWDNLGAALAAQEKLVEASFACQKAVEFQPDFPEAWFRLGVIYFQNDDFVGAEGAFQHARTLLGFASYTNSYLAMIHARQGKTDQAEEDIQSALDTDPECDLLWMAWSELAQMYLNQSEFERAAQAYERVVLIRPDEFDIWFKLGLAHEHRGAWMESMIAYQTASQIKDQSPIVWQKLAQISTLMDDHASAITALHRVLELQPEDSDRWTDLGLAYARCEMHDDSEQAFSHADHLRRNQNLQIANLPHALEVARRMARDDEDEDRDGGESEDEPHHSVSRGAAA
ncbi:MAG: tetratricopeptide repeat protein [Candidatus Methylacidiphilales bacterium]|nr:tetratricopeptide repeat protein [Candidatus Methylacidiphilales bacterium]